MFSTQGSQVMKTSFSLLEILPRENLVFITGMGLQCSVYTSKHLNLAKTQLGSTILHMTQFGPISAIELPKKELKRCIIESISAALPVL